MKPEERVRYIIDEQLVAMGREAVRSSILKNRRILEVKGNVTGRGRFYVLKSDKGDITMTIIQRADIRSKSIERL